MTIAILFWLLVVGCCVFAASLGGWEGRWFAAIYITQSVLTTLALFVDGSWSGTNWPNVAIGVFLLIAFWCLAARSRRFWPLWVFGFHLISMSAHLPSLFLGVVPFKAYFFLANMWVVPKLLVVVIGISIDRRAGLPPAERNGGRRDREASRTKHRSANYQSSAAA